MATAGLELLRAGQKTQAQELAENALVSWRAGGTKKGKLSPPDAPAVWALGLALAIKDVETLRKKEAEEVRLAGEAMAAAQGGRLDEARELSGKINTPELKLALKRAYRLVFNSDLTVSQGIARARIELPQVPEVETFLRFIEASQRGVMV